MNVEEGTVTETPEEGSRRRTRLRSTGMPSSPAPRTKMEVSFMEDFSLTSISVLGFGCL
jgi:hypothetical protein